MRVIAGTFRSRPLQAPRGLQTRPTSDRLRETLFNVLGERVRGARFADLYAGSGAVGIEALSRGAERVYFAEKGAAALAALRANLRSLDLSGAAEIEAKGTASLLVRLGTAQPPARPATDLYADLPHAPATLDVVFLDPPYELLEEYSKTLLTLGSGRLLSPRGLVVAEHTRREPLENRYGNLHRTRTLLQGDVALSFYARNEAENP